MPSRSLALKRLQSISGQGKMLTTEDSALIDEAIGDLAEAFRRYSEICDVDIASSSDQEEIEEEFLTAAAMHDDTKNHLLRIQIKARPATPVTDPLITQHPSTLEQILIQQSRMLEAMSMARTKNVTTLPKLEIPTFTGDPKQWVHFRDLFISSIAANAALSGVQKLQYLRSLLKGNAASLIANVPINDANYDVAWNHLLDAYDNDYLVVESIYNRFLDCDKVRNDHANSRLVYNIFRETFEMLDNQSDYAKSRDPLAITIMLRKLDAKTHRAWVEHSKGGEEPSIQSFLDFYKTQCFIQDRSRTNEHSSSAPHSNNHSLESRRKPIRIHTATGINCMFCHGDHSVYKCSKFLASSIEDRESFLAKQSRCFNCLGKSHSIKQCSSTKGCSKCGKRHNSLLHRDSPPVVSLESTNSQSSNPDQQFLKTHASLSASALLPTAVVLCRTSSGEFVSARMLLDSGSQATLITESLTRQLGLQRFQARVPISGVGDQRFTHSKGKVELCFSPRFSTVESFATTAYVVPTLTSKLPQSHVNLTCMKDLVSKFDLADPDFNIPSDIDIIAGASVFFDTILSSTYFNKSDGIHVQETRLGHVICSRPNDTTQETLSYSCRADSVSDDDVLLQRFWSLDEGPQPKSLLSPDETRCEKHFESTVSRLPCGRFSVSLPFKENPDVLGRSFETALRRFKSLEQKLNRNVSHRQEYVKFMTEYERLGHMQLTAYTAETLPSAHYLIPHHGIWQCGPTGTKFRVVFDASAKTSTNVSLNSILHTGPRLQLDISTVIHGFRKHRYVLSADIEKMYRQIQIHQADRDFQLIIWRDDPNKPLKIFQLATVTYGESCSPYLALRALQELAHLESSNHPEAVRIIQNNRYVDDLLFGHDDIDHLLRIKNEVIHVLKLGRFELKKWASNEPSLLSDHNPSDLVSPRSFTDKEGGSIKALGIVWEPSRDRFSFRFETPLISHWTKRQLLAESARLYDPLGWIAPVVLKLKMLLQDTWARRVGWDDDLPDDIISEWRTIRAEIPDLSNFSISRFLQLGEKEIHGFCDASKTAYAAVVYVRTVLRNGSIVTSLVSSKTKLAPLKPISIPRLELCGAQLLAKLIKRTQEDFPEITTTFLWTDSTTVLAWLKSIPSRWTTFVSNRVALIHELCPNIPWHYVKSAENPADIASRGCTPSQLLLSNLWIHGPTFLGDVIDYPKGQFTTIEEAAAKAHVAIIPNSFWLTFVERHSSFHRLVRSLSYVLRLRDRLKGRPVSSEVHLSAEEVTNAFDFLIHDAQARHFSDELQCLRAQTPLKKSSRLLSLSPFLDDHGLLRARSRIVHSNEVPPTPIILPQDALTDLMISQTHSDTFHGGSRIVMSQIRSKFYVINLSRSVKRIIHRCTRCLRYQAATFAPRMGPLPASRTTPSKPFSTTGVDFAGPLSIRPFRGRGRTTLKSYIAIFVCFSTKAIHLELVMDLSTNALVMALQRFISRRGRCETIMSDNGRNFVGCHRHQNDLHTTVSQSIKSTDAQDFLSKNFISWKFIPAYSPHFGGLWEAGVKSVKTHLFRTVNSTILTIEELTTILCRIEAILNSRPLTPLVMSDSFDAITPAHLLMGGAMSIFPDISQTKSTPCSIRVRSKLLSTLTENFWQRWRTEYLSTLIRRSKWVKDSKQPKIGEIILIKRNFDPPCRWRLGRVVSFIPGHDGIARVAEIQSASGTTKEAIRNLIPLEVEPIEGSTGGEC